MQLTVDHDLTNEDELLRLSHTGLDVEKLHQSNNQSLTYFLTSCSLLLIVYNYFQIRRVTTVIS